MFIAAWPSFCENCTFRNDRPECVLCEKGYGVKEDDGTCEGNVISYKDIYLFNYLSEIEVSALYHF